MILLALGGRIMEDECKHKLLFLIKILCIFGGGEVSIETCPPDNTLSSKNYSRMMFPSRRQYCVTSTCWLMSSFHAFRHKVSCSLPPLVGVSPFPPFLFLLNRGAGERPHSLRRYGLFVCPGSHHPYQAGRTLWSFLPPPLPTLVMCACTLFSCLLAATTSNVPSFHFLFPPLSHNPYIILF
uniref:Uncharacterized protein n=1 Tax=Schistocephalus solidus TaxID=70667 RepID=A0A0V0J5U2_SCHSO